MRIYEFEFTTDIKFDLPIINHNFVLKFLPRTQMFQRIYDDKILIDPDCKYTVGDDSFGNKTLNGILPKEHSHFTFGVKGKAALGKYRIPENLDRLFFYPSKKTQLSSEMKAFFDGLTLSDDAHESAKIIADAVYDYMSYEKLSTNTDTTAAQAFEQKKGVCQDFAQITISLLRQAKIPARYAAGFMEGDGETHAWVEYYADGAWYGIDPTNKCVIEYGYIKISQGRDSYDCSVERGCFASKYGIVNQSQTITVKVGEIL